MPLNTGPRSNRGHDQRGPHRRKGSKLSVNLIATRDRVVDFPGRVVDLPEFAPIVREVLCASDRRMHLRKKVVNDVVLQREFQFLNVACVA